ncbi:MAG: tetratricopeptide repeat protein [Pseudomonadota bacterium]
MDVYSTEEEQLEKLREFFKRYGTSIIAALIIVVVVTFGWRYWSSHKEKVRGLASVGYEQMLNFYAQNKLQETKLQALYIRKEYPATPYASASSLLLAKMNVDEKDYAQAEKDLHWVIKNSDIAVLKNLARIRYARVAIAMKKPQQAIKTLTEFKNSGLSPMAEEVKGDAYLALGEKQNAKQAYQAALKSLPIGTPNRTLLQMKLDNLG